MAVVRVREGREADLKALRSIERSIVSEAVWRMNWAPAPAMGAVFERFPLPRPITLAYPRPLPSECPPELGRVFFVAAHNEAPVGYLCGDTSRSPGSLWLEDVVVAAAWRRKKIGQGLVSAAIRWAEAEGLQRVVLEMSFRNAPAVEFARKLGFVFSGFQYEYFANGDAALFMSFTIN